jgi:hypothetical protein
MISNLSAMQNCWILTTVGGEAGKRGWCKSS